MSLMADFNQALTLAEALRRGHALDDEGLYWIEEPIRHDDYPGYGTITRELATPIQIGENFVGPEALGLALAAQACDYVMPLDGSVASRDGFGPPHWRPWLAWRCPPISSRR